MSEIAIYCVLFLAIRNIQTIKISRSRYESRNSRSFVFSVEACSMSSHVEFRKGRNFGYVPFSG